MNHNTYWFEVMHYTDANGRDLIADWLSGLRDQRAGARISARIERLVLGLFGDCRSVKGGVWELRIELWPWIPSLFFKDGKDRNPAFVRRGQEYATI